MKIFRIFPQLDENKRVLRAGDRFSLRCGDAERAQDRIAPAIVQRGAALFHKFFRLLRGDLWATCISISHLVALDGTTHALIGPPDAVVKF